MSRNFGLGQRDMSKAGRVALERDSRAKGLSFRQRPQSVPGGVHSSRTFMSRESEKWRT